jgi:hypothetical protein
MPLLHNAQKRHAAWHKLSIIAQATLPLYLHCAEFDKQATAIFFYR